MAKIKKWTGVQDQDLYADIIYPKDTPEGTVRLVLRSASGRIKENVLDFSTDHGISVFPVAPALEEQCAAGVVEDGYFTIRSTEVEDGPVTTRKVDVTKDVVDKPKQEDIDKMEKELLAK
jgi:hypothetical protein